MVKVYFYLGLILITASLGVLPVSSAHAGCKKQYDEMIDSRTTVKPWLFFLCPPAAIIHEVATGEGAKKAKTKKELYNECVDREHQHYKQLLADGRREKDLFAEAGNTLKSYSDEMEVNIEGETEQKLREAAKTRGYTLQTQLLAESNLIYRINRVAVHYLKRQNSILDRFEKLVIRFQNFRKMEADQRQQFTSVFQMVQTHSALGSLLELEKKVSSLLSIEVNAYSQLKGEAKSIRALLEANYRDYSQVISDHRDFALQHQFSSPDDPSTIVATTVKMEGYLTTRYSGYASELRTLLNQTRDKIKQRLQSDQQEALNAQILAGAQHTSEMKFLSHVKKALADLNQANAAAKTGLSVKGRRLVPSYESYQAIFDYSSICQKLEVTETNEPHLYSGCTFLELVSKKAIKFIESDAWLGMSVTLLNMSHEPNLLIPDLERLKAYLKNHDPTQLKSALELHDDLLNRWNSTFQMNGAQGLTGAVK